MPTSIFQEIDSLHAQCAGMDKATKLGWLAGKQATWNGFSAND